MTAETTPITRSRELVAQRSREEFTRMAAIDGDPMIEPRIHIVR